MQRKTIISSCSGLGDQLFHYASSETISVRLKREIMLTLSFLDKQSLVNVKTQYSHDKTIQPSINLNIDCKPGRNKIMEQYQTIDFWEGLSNANVIHFNGNQEFLCGLIGNNSSSIGFNNKDEVVQELHHSLNRLFNKYCNVCLDLPKKNKYLVAIHIRTGDQQILHEQKWSSELKSSLHNIFTSIYNDLCNNPPENEYEVAIFTDANANDMYEYANHILKGINVRKPNIYTPVHSSMASPTTEQWKHIFMDFFNISIADRCYATPNSNFSRAALVYGNKFKSSYFVDGNGIKPVNVNNIVPKLRNSLFNDKISICTSTPDSNKFLSEILNQTNNYLEFGSGGSTIAAYNSIKGYGYSVESDRDWYEKMSNNIESSKIKMIYVDLESSKNNWGYPGPTCSPEKMEKYSIINNLVDLGSIDVILIDGRFRVSCALQIFKYIKSQTQVIVDDYRDRNHYHIIEKYYDIVHRVGTMVVFRKKKNSIIPHDILTTYLYDPR